VRQRSGSGIAAAAGVLAASGALLGAAQQPPPPEALPDGVQRLLTVQDDRIAEASGLAAGAAGGLLFVHEDAGRPAAVYALDDRGALAFVVDVVGAENLDWEDLATGTDEAGRPALYVADIGDAAAVLKPAGQPPRRAFSLVRLAEPQAPAEPAETRSPSSVPTVAAEDVATFPLEYSDARPRNAEALAVQPRTNRVFVIDKVGTGGRVTRLWVAPELLVAGVTNALTALADLPMVEVSGAAFSPDGGLLAVRTPTTAYLWRVEGDDVAAAVRAAPVEVALPTQRQGESIAFTGDGRSLLVGSEGVRQAVFTVPLPPAVAPSAPTPAEPTAAPPRPSEGRTSPPPLTWALGGGAGLVACLLGGYVVQSWRRQR
jgi:hypothetical protein